MDKLQSRKNSSLFLEYWNDIEEHLCRLAGESLPSDYVGRDISVAHAINKLEASPKHGLIKHKKKTLNLYKDLRNAIVHKSGTKYGGAIAEPHDNVVNDIRSLRDEIKKPQTALSISSKPVIHFQAKDSLSELIACMAKNNVTNVPIYEDSALVGIFSERTAVMWLSHQLNKEKAFISDAVKIADIVEMLDPVDGDEYNAYQFQSVKIDVYTAADLFSESMSRGKRLAAIFLSKDGTPRTPLEGVVTSWDIHRPE